MHVQITESPFNAWEILAAQERQMTGREHLGASAVFVGTMRDHNEGDAVKTLWLEHYPAMTQHYLQHLAEQTKTRWTLGDVLIVHRVGLIRPSETIVLTAAWSAHRDAALDACQYLIEELKYNAPFWKKEELKNGEIRWVQFNRPYHAQSE
ncbi:molybdenum cofactor biosynthesis protein MoaE [Thioflexithrix psekupsensis]|uniref:Molybdopterin synthase catalytic subunit n=1 Tax=Thioflexithrix psekupsensis TaxID=1570016 RepID=A0A251X4X4_9GAMM|nr:molybdenum cofactor biosynthesis protein MoaE [Thioflexithrix psekupsensis]OUD12202.1 molybdopterin converting factor [Thioflexithrix psekupsensis]